MGRRDRKNKSSKSSLQNPKTKENPTSSNSGAKGDAEVAEDNAAQSVKNVKTRTEPERTTHEGTGPTSSQETIEKDRCIERLISSLQAPRNEVSKGEYIERLINSIGDLMKLEGESFDSAMEKNKKLEQVEKELQQIKIEEQKKEEDKIDQICAFCKAPSATRCTGCRLVFYCNRDCQRKDWRVHKDVCRPYTVARRKEGERLLLASRDLKAGDVILHEAPLVIGPRLGSGPVCLTCYKRLTEYHSCSKCGLPFCSKQCEEGEHVTLECPVAEKAQIKTLTKEEVRERLSDAITALRGLIILKRDPQRWKSSVERFDCDFLKSVGSSECNAELVETLSHTLKIRSYPDLASVSDSEIQEMLGLLQIHNVPTKLPHGEVQGFFPFASLLSHSCIPNTKVAWHDESRKLRVTAAEGISRGTPLTTTFTDPLWGTRARRDHLQQTRRISCSCRRCKDPTELGTFFSALLCRRCPDKAPVLPTDPLNNSSSWACQKCNHQVSSAEVLQETLALGAAVSEVLRAPSVESSEELLQTWKERVHSNHYHLHALKHSLLQLYGREQEKAEEKTERHWEEMAKKERACKEFLRACALLDPPLAHTTLYVGVAFFEYHKTILQTAKRAFALARITSVQLKKRMFLSKELLRKAMDIFKDEPAGTPEAHLYATCQEEFIAIGKWMMAVGLA